MNITRSPQIFVPITITFELKEELNAFLRILDIVGSHPISDLDSTIKQEALSLKKSVMQYC